MIFCLFPAIFRVLPTDVEIDIQNIVVIGFKEHRKDIRISEERFLGIASNNNLEDYGKNIFSALRKADKIGANLIVIEGVKKEGLGIAIMNRLLRTCDYNYFECST